MSNGTDRKSRKSHTAWCEDHSRAAYGMPALCGSRTIRITPDVSVWAFQAKKVDDAPSFVVDGPGKTLDLTVGEVRNLLWMHDHSGLLGPLGDSLSLVYREATA